MTMICEEQADRVDRAEREHPGVRVTTNVADMLRDPTIDLIACATPVSTHHRLGKAVLEAGKHLLLEKPMTSTSVEASELLRIAARSGLQIFVDHTYVFTPAVQHIKSVIRGNDLGALYYYDSTRINLGLYQHDIDVVWDLGPHDLSILDFLLDGLLPTSVACKGVTRFGPHADQAYFSLEYPAGFFAHIHVNWLSPVKARQVLLCAEKRMVVYDDMALEKLRIYDRGVQYRQTENPYRHMISYREGDMLAPHLEHREALNVEVNNIVDALNGSARPMADGYLGFRVVRLLEFISESMHHAGVAIDVDPAAFASANAPL